MVTPQLISEEAHEDWSRRGETNRQGVKSQAWLLRVGSMLIIMNIKLTCDRTLIIFRQSFLLDKFVKYGAGQHACSSNRSYGDLPLKRKWDRHVNGERQRLLDAAATWQPPQMWYQAICCTVDPMKLEDWQAGLEMLKGEDDVIGFRGKTSSIGCAPSAPRVLTHSFLHNPHLLQPIPTIYKVHLICSPFEMRTLYGGGLAA